VKNQKSNQKDGLSRQSLLAMTEIKPKAKLAALTYEGGKREHLGVRAYFKKRRCRHK
jgi:hypothetical protein